MGINFINKKILKLFAISFLFELGYNIESENLKYKSNLQTPDLAFNPIGYKKGVK